MVASLLKSHVGHTTTKGQIFQLLGPSQCDGEAEGDLCYVVTRKAKKYQLDFFFDPRGSNRVAGVGLGEPQQSVKTIQVQANTR